MAFPIAPSPARARSRSARRLPMAAALLAPSSAESQGLLMLMDGEKVARSRPGKFCLWGVRGLRRQGTKSIRKAFGPLIAQARTYVLQRLNIRILAGRTDGRWPGGGCDGAKISCAVMGGRSRWPCRGSRSVWRMSGCLYRRCPTVSAALRNYLSRMLRQAMQLQVVGPLC